MEQRYEIKTFYESEEKCAIDFLEDFLQKLPETDKIINISVDNDFSINGDHSSDLYLMQKTSYLVLIEHKLN